MSNGQDPKAKSAALEMAQEGHRLLKSGDYEGAIVACNEAIELQPGALGARRTLAEAYERLARDREAANADLAVPSPVSRLKHLSIGTVWRQVMDLLRK